MKNRKIAIGAGIAALIVIIALFVLPRPAKVDRSLIGPEIKAYRVVQNGNPTDAAYVSVPFTRDDPAYVFANVAIDLDQDGTFTDYASTGGTQKEWIVRNARVKVITQGNDFSFALIDRKVDARKNLKLVAALTTQPLKDWRGALPDGGAGVETTIASFDADDFGALIAPISPNGTGGPAPDVPAGGGSMSSKTKFPDAKKWLQDATAPSGTGQPQGTGAGADQAGNVIGAAPANGVPPAGADFEVFEPDVPDMSQGRNECVPTSTSNALHWLGKRYGFSDKLPADQHSTMNELKADFNWSSDNGVDVEPDYIPGKVAFSRRHDLPIVTHQIGQKFDDHVVENVAAELAKGQAVEIVIGYYALDAHNTWVRHGGHMLSAVGAWGAGGQTFIGLHDPASPGTDRLDIYNVDKSRMYDYRYRGNYSVFIEYAIAESPTQEWLTAHPPQTAIETGGAAVESQDLQDVWFIDVLKIGGNYYPVKQFYVGTGPDCDAPHWHATTEKAWGLDLGLAPNAPIRFSPAEVKRRHAKTVEWDDPGHCGAGKIPDVPRLQLMISKDESYDLVAKVVH